MRRIVGRYATYYMPCARGGASTHIQQHTAHGQHARTRVRRNAHARRQRRAPVSPRERARAKRAAAAAAGRISRKKTASCPELQVVQLQILLKKLITLPGRGEAHALRARTLPRAREGRVRAGVALDHVLHDGENVCCASLSSCSMETGTLLMSGTSRAPARPRKFTEATTVPTSRAAPPQPTPGPRAGEHARLRASRREAP